MEIESIIKSRGEITVQFNNGLSFNIRAIVSSGNTEEYDLIIYRPMEFEYVSEKLITTYMKVLAKFSTTFDFSRKTIISYLHTYINKLTHGMVKKLNENGINENEISNCSCFYHDALGRGVRFQDEDMFETIYPFEIDIPFVDIGNTPDDVDLIKNYMILYAIAKLYKCTPNENHFTNIYIRIMSSHEEDPFDHLFKYMNKCSNEELDKYISEINESLRELPICFPSS